MPNRLRELREAQGLSLRALADRVGTSNQQLSHLELGKRQLTTDWLTRIAAVLGCHPWEIVGEVAQSGLTNRERQILANFQQLSEDEQDALIAETTPHSAGPGVRKRRAT